jgi:dienelactone hydrolase
VRASKVGAWATAWAAGWPTCRGQHGHRRRGAYYGGGIQNLLDLRRGTCAARCSSTTPRRRHIPPEAVAAVRAAHGRPSAEVHVYDGAQHGFNCWARASYHAPSAALAPGLSGPHTQRCVKKKEPRAKTRGLKWVSQRETQEERTS